ncbi:uncharacterized protein LOC143864186 isoform X2 [Tasmannia lanceolata]|uniref:uncharacterized protein LOC143864186 isoform X2 n=1 Tax=Tasmannia lanceolata TaxID=3420 RepID=UPI0040648875
MSAIVGSSTESNSKSAVEEAKKRLRSVLDRIESLPLSKITDSSKGTLLKLANSELKFLSRLTLSHPIISLNVGYLESVVHILEQPFVSGVSRVCKAIPLSSQKMNCGSHSKGIHVDIVCTVDRKPVWFIVSDRNPKYISWPGSHRNKGLRTRVEQVLAAAHSAQSLKPLLVILFFSNGVDDVVSQKLGDEFGAIEFGTEFCVPDSLIFTELEGEWVYVVANSNDTSRVYGGARAFQLKVDNVENTDLHSDQSIEGQITGAAELPENPVGLVSSNMFCSLISGMNFAFVDIAAAKPEAMSGEAMVNFDTTALVALVSGISNGGTERLLTTSESEMRDSFKNNFEFVMAQVMSELQNPILTVLQGVISGKRGMICESVRSEFNELLSMYGGPNEKWRASRLLKCLMFQT